MTYEVFGKKGKKQGILKLEAGGWQFEGHAPDFSSLIKSAWQDGVFAESCVFVEKTDEHIIVRKYVDSTDVNFHLFLKRHLENKNYTLIQHRPELDSTIIKAIQSSSKDDAAKKRLVADVPRMTYLEKTMTVEALKKQS
jgi:hypothetical protein